VYEIESRVRDLRRAATSGSSETDQQQQQKESPKDEKQNNTNREPEHRQQYQNYSRENDDVLVALGTRLTDPGRQRREV
jgi:hypothetical protein